MSALERKWWFVGLAAALSSFGTNLLLDSAGMPRFDSGNVARWLVHTICFIGIWRCVAFIGWLIVLMISPSLAGAKTDSPSSRPAGT
jgi:hypothetical protein